MCRVWRLLSRPVLDWPLGVCDTRSVDSNAELVLTDNIFIHTINETYNVFYSPEHKWHFINKQMDNEYLLFKGFDNAENVVMCKFFPHQTQESEHYITGL